MGLWARWATRLGGQVVMIVTGHSGLIKSRECACLYRIERQFADFQSMSSSQTLVVASISEVYSCRLSCATPTAACDVALVPLD